jgi:hypothetical protein
MPGQAPAKRLFVKVSSGWLQDQAPEPISWRLDSGINIVNDNERSLQDSGRFVTVFSPAAHQTTARIFLEGQKAFNILGILRRI